MAIVTFKGFKKDVEIKFSADHPTKANKVARKITTATFDVDGVLKTLTIPEKFEGSIDDYIKIMARDLAREADKNAVKTVIETPKIKTGTVLIDSTTLTI